MNRPKLRKAIDEAAGKDYTRCTQLLVPTGCTFEGYYFRDEGGYRFAMRCHEFERLHGVEERDLLRKEGKIVSIYTKTLGGYTPRDQKAMTRGPASEVTSEGAGVKELGWWGRLV
jgi:hypothetical protein